MDPTGISLFSNRLRGKGNFATATLVGNPFQAELIGFRWPKHKAGRSDQPATDCLDS